ncbi:hypothetical protein CSB45_07870 [candidate division KSB3 bacterium]|uniref:PA14 domain-containing protein n=1 Tax=candidate division KSB3 bacterium TaxID=2044937 RepID=A0A2G6E652_9BACT|nr:MAG: hypothetical protein CSB45_07870 [candidate division KSB3 bacterium]PIE29946.1 MAG: hypothetical protein CSA57_06570 [candidate division KSB3 bacterium]
MHAKFSITALAVVLLDSIIVVYTAITLLIALSGSFFLQLGPLVFSISRLQKPLALVAGAFVLRKILSAVFFTEIFSVYAPLKYRIESVFQRLRALERWLTSPLWRGLVLVLSAALLYAALGLIQEQLPFEYGLRGEYYSNPAFEGEPILSSRDTVISVQEMNREFPEIAEQYSIRWTGFLYLPYSGHYTFSLASDDGSWLTLDGKLIVDNGGVHGLREYFGDISLTRGVYPLEIRYVQGEKAAGIRLRWSILDRPMRQMAGDIFFQTAPSMWRLTLRACCRFGMFVLKVAGLVVLMLILLYSIHPVSSSGVPRMLRVLWLLALGFGMEFWLMRRAGLRDVPFCWEVLCWCINLAMILLLSGIRLRRISLKAVLQNALLLLFSLSLLLGLFEIVLRTGIFDEKGTIWIPKKYVTLNNEINAKNWETANKHPYKFTDILWEKEKARGISRIAVLGDSFVWGTAIPSETAWGHKLAARIQKKYHNIEVMNWGYPGWSTVDEFNFLSTKGIKYAPDVLIVGFVRNDPDLGDYRWKLFDLRTMRSGFVRAALWPVKTIFPTVFDFTAAHLNEFLMNYFLKEFGYGWQAWYERIYSPQNLQRYYLLLKKMADFCEEQGIQLIVVLTPATYKEAEGQKFQAMASLLDRLGIEYLNLYPAVVRDLSHYPSRDLWGNPGDPHPGGLMTELFANETFSYLEKRKILPSLKTP